MKRAAATALAVVAAVMVGALAWAALRTGAPNHARPVERHRPLEFTSSVSLSDLQAHMTYSRNLEAIAVGDLAVAVAQAELDAFLASLAPSPAPARASYSAPSRGTVGDCSGFSIPDYIIQRESGGNPSAVNPSSGAYGCAQTMPGHYQASSPWNPSVPGTCYGLDMYDINGQRECVNRLSNGGTNLDPWAETR